MEIYTIIIDHKYRLTFKKKYSRYQLVFQIEVTDNKPELSGYWSGFGGFGGSLSISKAKLWSLFLRTLKDDVMKDQLEYRK